MLHALALLAAPALAALAPRALPLPSRLPPRAGQLRLRRGMSELVWIDAGRSRDSEGAELARIKDALLAEPPDAVLIEGVSSPRGRVPAEYLAWADRTWVGRFVEAGPGGYAALLASAAGIPVYGAEPPARALLAELRREGFAAADLQGLAVLRRVPRWIEDGRVPARPVGELAAALMTRTCAEAGVARADCMDFPRFERWYRARAGKPFGASLDGRETNPDPSGAYLQRAASVVDRARNRFAAGKLRELLRAHPRVLAVLEPSRRAALLGPGR